MLHWLNPIAWFLSLTISGISIAREIRKTRTELRAAHEERMAKLEADHQTRMKAIQGKNYFPTS